MTNLLAKLEDARLKGDEPSILKPNGRFFSHHDADGSGFVCTAYPTTDGAIEVVLGGGDLRHVHSVHELVNEAAHDEGAQVIRIIGRHGWAKVFGMTVVGRDGDCWVMEKAVA